MSEQAPEAPPGGGGGGAGGFLKRKLGPFAMWAWLLIGAAIIFGVVYFQRQRAGQSAAAGQADQSVADNSTDASQIPQFVNQTYTTVTPPPAPVPSSVGTPIVLPPKPPVSHRPTQITASGKDTGDINQIAKAYGLTEKELIKANPQFRHMKVRSPNGRTIPLIGSGAPVPKGTVIKIPAA